MESETANDIFSDVYSDEWQADFRKKEELLSKHFSKITPEEYYRQIFGSVESPSKLLLQEPGQCKNVKNFKQAEEYLAEHEHVSLYLQSFFKNSLPKIALIDKCFGIVVELDNVRSARLPDLITKISSIDLKPSMLVSSGNGIHLYYLFSEPFDFFSFTSTICMLGYIKREDVFEVVKQVYNKLSDLYVDEGIGYKVDRMHLSQPIRMCGSTTKNVNFRTVGYRVSNERRSLEEYAELLGVELFDDELAKLIDQYLHKDTGELPEDVIKELEPEAEESTGQSNKFNIFDDIDTTFFEFYKDNKSEVRARWLEYAKQLGDEDRPKAATVPVGKKKYPTKEPNYSNYLKTLLKVMYGASVGNRQKLMTIFCSRAAMYRVPEDRMKKDARTIRDFWNNRWPKQLFKERELECAFKGRKYWYSNETIWMQTGVDLSIENKREAKKAVKEQKRSGMQKCAVEFIQANRDCSYSDITEYLASSGHKVSLSMVKRDAVIKAEKERE